MVEEGEQGEDRLMSSAARPQVQGAADHGSTRPAILTAQGNQKCNTNTPTVIICI